MKENIGFFQVAKKQEWRSLIVFEAMLVVTRDMYFWLTGSAYFAILSWS